MFLRMVTHDVRPEESDRFAAAYTGGVLPTLARTNGCVFAALLQDVDDTTQGLSLTIWHSPAESRTYEESGVYAQLVDVLRPFFKASDEYTLQLSDDLSLEYTPIVVEPTVERFDRSIVETEHLSNLRSGLFAVQSVTLSVLEGETANFERFFAEQILPRFRSSKGFMDLILLRQEREYHLISFWDGAVDVGPSSALRTNGELLTGIHRMLPSFVRGRSAQRAHRTVSSEDLSARVFRCLTAEWFERS